MRSTIAIAVTLLILFSAALLPYTAEGGKGWCRSDPVFTVTSPTGEVRSFAVIGGADKQLQSATYVLRVPPGYTVDVRWEYYGLAVNENTVTQVGTVGSSFKFSLVTTPKAGETAEIDIIAAERFGETKTATGVAGTQIWVTYTS